MSELSLTYPSKVGRLMSFLMNLLFISNYPPSSIGSQRDMSNQEKGLEKNKLDFELFMSNLGAQIFSIQRS